MKVLLLRDMRIRHRAGEVVEVSPEEANYLMSTMSAKEAPKRKKKNESADRNSNS